MNASFILIPPAKLLLEVVRVRTRKLSFSLAWVLVVLMVADRLISSLWGTESLFLPLAADGLRASGAGFFAFFAIGHCDSMDGPVITQAKKAIESGNVNLVLPWVRPADEADIRAAFENTLAVRKLGPQAAHMADMYFFETLVRVHRAGEGTPYSGIKPAGIDLGPAIPAADKALKEGAAEAVIGLLGDAIRKGVDEHLRAVLERQQFDRDDVAAGREYVEAYVPYLHYVERLWQAATGSMHDHHAGQGDHSHKHE